MRQVNMLDLSAEFALYGEAVRASVDRVFESQRFIGGPPVEELESALARRLGVAHAVAVSNGSDAILCALIALDISAGAEVIVPAFTFFATGGSVARTGAIPVFVDVDPRTYNIDPGCVERAVTDRTCAIIPVHLFGQCAAMDAINEIARTRGMTVIEDAAQAIGATYHGRPAGTLGHIACLSFYPTKNLGGCGEGGMILTGDDGLADRLRKLRNHGQSSLYTHACLGGNFRLDTLKAAALIAKLDYLDEFTRRRRHNAARYRELLGDAPVTLPHVSDGNGHVYHQFTITCDRRDALREFLRDRGVGTGLFYPIPLHRQPCFASTQRQLASCPVAERLCERVVSLPCHPMLDEDDLEYVASQVRAFYATARSPAATAACERAG